MGTIGQTGKGERAERGLLGGSLIGIVAAIGLAVGLAQPVRAAPTETFPGSEAETLRRLDIMLMVTGLRCRTTADNFTDDYARFTSRHMGELNAANRDLRTRLATRMGAAGAAKALDRMSVVMANEYGNGHPWLSCGELRQVTRSLALVQGHATLVEAAGQLLERQPTPVLALAGR